LNGGGKTRVDSRARKALYVSYAGGEKKQMKRICEEESTGQKNALNMKIKEAALAPWSWGWTQNKTSKKTSVNNLIKKRVLSTHGSLI